MTVRPKTTMVVAQGGAQISSDEIAALGDHVLTVAQEEGESLEALAQRVRRSSDYLRAHGARLEHVLFVARQGFDLQDVPATADLVRTVVTHMVACGGGEVHLHTAGEGCPRARYALRALADAVSEQVRGTGVRVVTNVPEPSQTIVLDELRRRAASA